MEPAEEMLCAVVRQIAGSCPRIVAGCYWSGTSAIAPEVLHHRRSLDIALHTRDALVDTRPLLAELRARLEHPFELTQAPDALGSGFAGVIAPAGAEPLTLQLFASYEEVGGHELADSTLAPGMKRLSLARYLKNKVQCVAERLEARDLYDIEAALAHDAAMASVLVRAVAEQDALILAERLLGWTDVAIGEDLRAYSDIAPERAIAARERLLELLEGAR